MPTTRAHLGIDLTETHVHLVETVDRGRHQELTAYASTRLPEPNTYDRSSLTHVTRTIQQLIEQAQITAATASIALPSRHLLETITDVPATTDNWVNLLQLKARERIPLLDDTITLGWSTAAHSAFTILGHPTAVSKQPPPTTEPTTTYLVAIPTSIIDWHQHLADRLSLTLISLQPPAHALANLQRDKHPGEQYLLVLSESQAHLHIIHHGVPKKTHQLATSDLTIALPEVADTLGTHLAPYLNPSLSDPPPLILVGSLPNLSSLATLLAKHVPQSVSIINSWTDLAHPAELAAKLPQRAPQFAVATGLTRHAVPAIL